MPYWPLRSFHRRRLFARTRYLWLPVIALLCVALPQLDQGDWRKDTGRYAAIGLEAVSRGLDGEWGRFFVMHGPPEVLYLNKPPLAIWTHGAVLAVTGRELWAARLPAVLAGAVCVACVAGVARTMSTRAVALASGTAVALSYEFFRRTREISLDMWQLMWLLLAILLIAKGVTSARARSVLLAGVPIGLALLTKPFVGLLVVPIVASWVAWERRWKLLPVLVGTALIAVVVAWPWHLWAWHATGDAFSSIYLGREVVGRAAGEMERDPWWYYAPLLLNNQPWVLFVPVALCAAWRRSLPPRMASLARLAIAWTGAWLTLITLFPDKAPRYGLPVYAGMAWLSGIGLIIAGRGVARVPWRAFSAWLLPVSLGAFAAVSFLPIRVQAPPAREWREFEALVASEAPVSLRWGAFGYAKACAVYMRTGQWSTPYLPGEEDIDVGAWLIYHCEAAQNQRRWPGEGQTVLLEEDVLIVTRVDRVPPGFELNPPRGYEAFVYEGDNED